MNKYKPEYLGKVLPVDDSSKLTDFVQNQYESFNDIYAVCKDQSDSISNIMRLDSGDGSLSVKIDTDPESTRKIMEAVSESQTLSMSGNVITAVHE